jgi:hypothetical protein
MASVGLPSSPAFARSTSSAAAAFTSVEVVLPVPIVLMGCLLDDFRNVPAVWRLVPKR